MHLPGENTSPRIEPDKSPYVSFEPPVLLNVTIKGKELGDEDSETEVIVREGSVRVILSRKRNLIILIPFY